MHIPLLYFPLLKMSLWLQKDIVCMQQQQSVEMFSPSPSPSPTPQNVSLYWQKGHCMPETTNFVFDMLKSRENFLSKLILQNSP